MSTTQHDLDAYAADARPAPQQAENVLAQITNVVRELREARGDVKEAEDALKAAQDRVRTLEEVTIPDLMREAKQERLRTEDGYDVELTETLRASIPPANLHLALPWLIEHGQASIIKREFKLKFGRDENERAEKYLGAVLEAGFVPEDKQAVHPQTLQAVLRELIAGGEEVPLAMFGGYIQSGVKVKEAKARR